MCAGMIFAAFLQLMKDHAEEELKERERRGL
jgi:hypothetical protein